MVRAGQGRGSLSRISRGSTALRDVVQGSEKVHSIWKKARRGRGGGILGNLALPEPWPERGPENWAEGSVVMVTDRDGLVAAGL